MNCCFNQQDVASYEMDDDDDNDGVVPQRRGQVSQEQEDLVVKGKAFGSFVTCFPCIQKVTINTQFTV